MVFQRALTVAARSERQVRPLICRACLLIANGGVVSCCFVVVGEERRGVRVWAWREVCPRRGALGVSLVAVLAASALRVLLGEALGEEQLHGRVNTGK